MNPISGKLGRRAGFAMFAAAALGAASAQASVVVSADPTENVTCSAGVCTATAADAVLNVNELAGMLAGGDVTIVSGALAQDIEMKAALSWVSTSRLTLDSFRSIAFDKPVVVAGAGALTITVNDGGVDGDFAFHKKGHVEFWDTHSSLVIEGQSYTLVRKLARLAHLARNDPAGFYALARDYDAAKNGVFTRLVIPELDGALEGLGNTISNFTQKSNNSALAFCAVNNGTIRDIALVNANISGQSGRIAALVAQNDGVIRNASVSGQVSGREAGSYMGGLVARNTGTISGSHSSALVDGRAGSYVTGGLVGFNLLFATITASYATGDVMGGGATGGLVGQNQATLSQSYATGSVSASGHAVGGLMGESAGPVSDVYATGPVTGGIAGGLVGESDGNPISISRAYSTGTVIGNIWQGGFAGEDSLEAIANSYWNLTTSGISDPADGAGTPKNDPGITGLTSTQLKSGLPSGFDPSIWAQDPHINNGYPYLRAVPPG